jgi:hypothetical protein
MKNKFPLYVVSKGRSQYLTTPTVLNEMKVNHYIVVEPDQVDDYKAAVKKKGLISKILPMDMKYRKKYELLDEFGLAKSTGPGPARNFAWDHSMSNGHEWHWVMDDNITHFYRYNKNLIKPCKSPAFWAAMEDFVLRYTNVAMAGPQYEMFVSRKKKHPPFSSNCRIYSCNLIRNDVPYRWRGRYNEDTILSLDMMSDKWCTIQFNAFLQNKMMTQQQSGGNTEEFYHAEGKLKKGEKYAENGTLAKSQMLVDTYPDIAKLKWRFGRIHHSVDYLGFKKNILKRKENLNIEKGVNNFGMKLVKTNAKT